jgi:glycosyltransferase involved in cell wall biosynthesis
MAAPSGPGTHIREVIQGFEQGGHEVVRFIAGGETLSGGHAIQIKKRSWKKFVPTYIWQSLKDFSLKRLDVSLENKLDEIIVKEKPDVIYERAYYLMGSGHRAAKRHQIPYFVEINAPYPEEKAEMNGRSIYHQAALRNEFEQVTTSKKSFVVSTALRDYLERHVPGSTKKIIVTPNAVNPTHIRIDESKVNEIRQKVGATKSDVVIGFVGSIFPYHGVDLLISTFVSLVNEGKNNIRLLIVGDGEILPQLKQDVIQAGLQNKIHFTGNVPHREVYHHIQAMDITVMARSNWYGSPVKIFEYGIMNKAIIAPNVIPVRDVMLDKKDGLLINDSKEELSSALEYLLQHPEEMKNMAQHFYDKVKNNHTWQHVSNLIVEEMK